MNLSWVVFPIKTCSTVINKNFTLKISELLAIFDMKKRSKLLTDFKTSPNLLDSIVLEIVYFLLLALNNKGSSDFETLI